MISPYPLIFEPILLEKVWGGRRLARLGKSLPAGVNIGESWELADLGATSASGAGGGAARSVIANGPLAGKTLHDAMDLWRRDLMGSARPLASGEFPLLVKFLDARESLSVQVHPSPSFAAANKDAHLKTECWYILAVEGGTPPVIYKGVRPGVTREAFERHIRDGTVVQALNQVPAVPGECHTLPSGTVHALGAGVLVAEVQTPSDTTFRVFDWGRSARELHVAQALQCIDFGPAPGAARLPAGKVSGRLVGTEFFQVHEAFVPAGGMIPLGDEPGAPRVVLVLGGGATLRAGADEPLAVGPGATVLIPAAIVPGTAVRASPGTRALVITPA